MSGKRITKSTHPWCESSLHLGITESDAIVEQEDTVTVHHGVSVRRPPLTLQELLLVRVEAQLRNQERLLSDAEVALEAMAHGAMDVESLAACVVRVEAK